MAIKDEIDAKLRQARKDRDARTINVVGLIKNKVLAELKSGSGVVESDALWLDAIAAYQKGVKKAMVQFEELGDRGAEALDEAKFEVAFCEQFLPTKLDEAATEALVRKLVADNSLSGAASMGRLMGLVMKGHKDEVDGAIVKAVAQRVLAES